ncbi:MAG: chlorate reductase subunit gamma [Candidatus Rokubacteria bacterium]|nr:chlorate reductase subunit gamma [Candidatus Rokubacteria bacterium]
MRLTSTTTVVISLLALALVAGGLGSARVGAQPKAGSNVVKTLALRQHVDATSPEAAVWKRAAVTRVALQPAFPGHPSIVGTPSTVGVAVQALRTPESLYVRLEWRDATVDTTVTGPGRFVDAAAVQFPANGLASTTPFMGDPANRVNIWSWRADGRPQALLAAGFGTLTPAAVQNVRALGMRAAESWQVVLTRRLAISTDDDVKLVGLREIPVAFAIWNGSNRERDGFKAVTLAWWTLRF